MKSLLSWVWMFFPLLTLAQGKREPKIRSIDSAAVAILKLPGSPDFLAAEGDDVWVLNNDRVEKLSKKSPKPILSVSVPGACGAMVAGYGSLWVASCSKKAIYRIDFNTGKLRSIIPCGVSDKDGEIMLAAGDNSVWVLSDSTGLLTRISIKTNKIQSRLAVKPNSHCAVFGFNSVWITNTVANSVQRIDPQSNRVTATITVGKTPRFLAAGENGIWTLNQGEGTVSHINPKNNKVASVIDTKVPGSGGDIAAGAGRVWVRSGKNRLLQTINPATNVIEAFYGPVSGSGAVRVTANHVWVTSHDIHTIWILNR